MVPFLSEEDACELHCQLVLWTCSQLLHSKAAEVELSVAGAATHPLFDECLALGVARITPQQGDDLGQRMYRALVAALQQHESVLLVGSDCPGIDSVYIEAAFAALKESDVVLGPATDGGYVLIGAKRINAGIFEDINWGTEQVFEQTVESLRKTGLSWACLPTLSDIDRPEDLPVWEMFKHGSS